MTTEEPTTVEREIACNNPRCIGGMVEYTAQVRDSDDPFEGGSEICNSCDGEGVVWREVTTCCGKSDVECVCATSGKDFSDVDVRRVHGLLLELEFQAEQAREEMDKLPRDASPKDVADALSYYRAMIKSQASQLEGLDKYAA